MSDVTSKASKLDPSTAVAVIGYRGSAQLAAKNLVRAGHDVRVAVRPGGMSWVRAFEDGFRPVSIAEAVPGAGVVVVAVPELEQSQLFAQMLAKHLASGTLVLLEATAAAVAGAVVLPDDVDVACARLRPTRGGETSSPAGTAATVIAVHRDATGHATERTAAFARAAFGADRLVTSNFSVEADIDVAAYAAEKGSSQALLAAWDDQTSTTGYEPNEARQRTLESLSAAVSDEGPLRLPPTPPSSRPVAGGAQ